MERGHIRPITFGTDGWRARTDGLFDGEYVGLVIQALAEWVRARGGAQQTVVVGFDGRAGGPASQCRRPASLPETVFRYHSRHGVNGIKLRLEGERWVLVRSSETEPLVRVYAEDVLRGESRTIAETALRWVPGTG